ncbi:bifunctional diaminohydroxyphosphoribosylaminopyrimidine deaminase/5-amino-6-(5-phosphoribosylamino)uracil reductase RibD [Archangium lipolyticum]|uniref:bifunctional diaminohydroxyphosphoribosylaminopyrimidine deaminase/5-amino-6-(5-phosphoribosylamino)uracil reductase RibD n=1 Tax=Archangium lipolyticum TaxID=2970465 RepID=UPI002149D0CB|nr:bifunctional diaminohydroxyphosphoribosylaminopyrimidine deaminase/5-amino-6-(5-phosphoribosylamino)uracil reductase RibD [Archangium lipolyticum]
MSKPHSPAVSSSPDPASGAALSAQDEAWMRLAIELGEQARGHTGDNPYVGCVIVVDGRVVGSGYTQPPYQPHAEASAFLDAERRGHEVRGGTLYTTVEPCCFFGRTPPCAQAIIDRGLARVVVGIRDPHPRVNGQGIAQLRAAGIEVTEHVCREEVRAYLAGWLAAFGPDAG